MYLYTKSKTEEVPVHNHGELLYRFPIQQNIHLDQISSLVACILIIKAVEGNTKTHPHR